MLDINIIGAGTGNQLQLTKEAETAIERSCCLIGDRRILSAFEHLGKSLFYTTNARNIMELIEGFLQEDLKRDVSILVSGDVGFYSLSKSLLAHFGDRENIRLICGISSLQYFAAKLRTSWDDAVICSMHGRNGSLTGKVMNHQKVFALTGGDNSPSAICRQLCEFGLGHLKVSIGENLSYEKEAIHVGAVKDFVNQQFDSLSVMMIENETPLKRHCATHGLPDEWFLRGEVPMTKQEIRTISLSKLQLCTDDVAYDIGAGTGSVAVEMALQLTDGVVYAVEKNEEAVELIGKNKEKFGVSNLKIISNTAPEGLAEIPAPDKVFIGGSSGNLKEILDTVYEKNPGARVVINAITLETLGEAVDYYRNREGYSTEVIQVMVSKARKLGDYHLMTGQNPVFILLTEPENPGN